MRISLIVLSCLVAALTIALFTMTSQSSAQRTKSERRANADRAKLLELQTALEESRKQRSLLETENRSLWDELAGLKAMHAALLNEELIEALEIERDPIVETAGVEEELVAPVPPENEVRRRRAEEMRGQFQQQMRTALDERFAALEDPATLERLDALNEWRDYQSELRQEMRDAESEEERAAIVDELQNARLASQQIVDEEQDALLSGLAEQYGINDSDDQAAFIAALQETLDSPFFQLERMLVGGRGGPRGGMFVSR